MFCRTDLSAGFLIAKFIDKNENFVRNYFITIRISLYATPAQALFYNFLTIFTFL